MSPVALSSHLGTEENGQRRREVARRKGKILASHGARMQIRRSAQKSSVENKTINGQVGASREKIRDFRTWGGLITSRIFRSGPTGKLRL